MTIEARVKSRRGHLLVVGASEMFAEVLPPLVRLAQFTPDLFDAVGRISQSSAADPCLALLVPDAVLDGGGHRAIEAIRELDPSLVVIRLAAHGAPHGALPDAGFDAIIPTPIDAAMFAELTGIALAPQQADSGRGAEVSSEPESVREQIPVLEPIPEPTPPVAAQPEVIVPDGASAAERPVSTIAPVAAPPAADPLGDTDLVAAIMASDLNADCATDAGNPLTPGPILAPALTVARQQGGFDQLVFNPDPCAGSPVGSPPVGSLVARDADREQLDAWATWLAKWLELDAQFRRHRLAAYRDELTGAWNRRYFREFLDQTLEIARTRRRMVTVMFFDIDDFKHYNDAFSHEAGDVVLCETVQLLKSVIRQCDRVCRIGGDEFAVIFADLEEPREPGSCMSSDVAGIARRFQSQISSMPFRRLGLDAPGALSISAGLAAYPWDGHDAETLLRLADERALESKRKGKNHITFGPPRPGPEEPATDPG